MNGNDWFSEIKIKIEQVLSTTTSNKSAVFDVDGTLWHDDIGEGFFKYQVKNQSAPGLRGISDPLKQYFNLEENDPDASYGWLAQINAGLSEQEMARQAQDCYELGFRKKIHQPVKKLIADLKKNSFDVWICSASIRWAVAPLLKDLGLPNDRLIGTEVSVTADGILTDKIITPVPYRSGKKYWVEKKLKSKPQLVAGNSHGDLDILELATELPLSIIYQPHRKEVEISEKKLMAAAQQRGWPVQIFNSQLA
ncbi:MAG: HAD family hydrolase [Oligoflexia bacterium]|nr:HAD family hydrolase [Oligoflexia bacterium]